MSVNRIKLLRILIDGRLNLNYHASQLCKKASNKIHTLTRVCKYMDQNRVSYESFGNVKFDTVL